MGVIEPVNALLNPPKYLNAVTGIVRGLVKCPYADLVKMFQRLHPDLSRTAQYDAVKRAVEFGTKNGLLRIEKSDGEKYVSVNQPVMGLTFNAPLQ